MADLRTQLDSTVDHMSRHVRRERARTAWPEALALGMPVLLGAPLILVLAHWIAGLELLTIHAISAVIVPFVALVALRLGQARFGPVARGAALDLADATVASQGRLRTAEEFLRDPAATGFMRASIEDARPFAERALLAEPNRGVLPVALPRRLWLYPALGLAVFLLGLLIEPLAFTDEPQAPRQLARGHTAPAQRGRKHTPEPAVEAPPAAAVKGARPNKARAATDRASGTAERYGEDLPDATRGTEARARAGQSAQGGTPSRAAQSAGSPSDHEQVSEDNKRRASRASKPSSARTAPPARAEKKKAKERSGATAGSGSTSSSSRNPTTSKWSSKDRVPTADEELDDDDDEVEDEDEESEARGGVQPNLRGRKPPVNRDLSIGFGNQPNPNANGRGGPSQRKKSRGTASLVLGVPIPDHVRGNPNPGRTKVTQERVEPRTEKASPARPAPRRARSTPIGHVARPELSPWLRRILRTYFARRPGGAAKKAPSKETNR